MGAGGPTELGMVVVVVVGGGGAGGAVVVVVGPAVVIVVVLIAETVGAGRGGVGRTNPLSTNAMTATTISAAARPRERIRSGAM